MQKTRYKYWGEATKPAPIKIYMEEEHILNARICELLATNQVANVKQAEKQAEKEVKQLQKQECENKRL